MKFSIIPDREDWIYFKDCNVAFSGLEPKLLPDIEEWLCLNCPNRWHFSWNNEQYILSFLSIDDHLLFMLVWGDNV